MFLVRFFIFNFIILSLFLRSTSCYAESAPSGTLSIPSLIDSIKVKEPLDFCKERVPQNDQFVKEQFEKELLLILWDKPQIILWLKRAGRYFPYIEKSLKENNMPEDLKYVAIIESSLRADAKSSAGATGFWQFISSTGKRYGLRIDSEIDERRNIYESTKAAINYFKDLYKEFGAWTLSAAGYNMGEEGLKSEILIQKTNNYYLLSLPSETQRYVFRIICAKLIISNSKKYGFDMISEDVYSPFDFDRVEINCNQITPVQIIAEASKTYYRLIKELNPEITGRYLPQGKFSLSVPKGSGEIFNAQFEKILKQWQENTNNSIYVVKKGENLSIIAQRFNVPLPAILIWNQLSYLKQLKPGDKLVIYPR